MPTTAVVTPGTIAINATQQLPTQNLQVLQLRHNHSTFVEVPIDDPYDSSPSLELKRVLTPTALNACPLKTAFNAPFANASYALGLKALTICYDPANQTFTAELRLARPAPPLKVYLQMSHNQLGFYHIIQ